MSTRVDGVEATHGLVAVRRNCGDWVVGDGCGRVETWLVAMRLLSSGNGGDWRSIHVVILKSFRVVFVGNNGGLWWLRNWWLLNGVSATSASSRHELNWGFILSAIQNIEVLDWTKRSLAYFSEKWIEVQVLTVLMHLLSKQTHASNHGMPRSCAPTINDWSQSA